MATVTRTYLIDDLDGSKDDVENVLLALDGMSYEIDLSAANAGRLREKLERFVAAASPVKAVKSAPAGRGPKGKAAKTAPAPSNRALSRISLGMLRKNERSTTTLKPVTRPGRIRAG